MEQALDQMTEDTYDQAVIDAYLDALDAKTPMPEAPNVEESYGQFQAMLSQALPDETPSKPQRRWSVLRMTLRVALAAAFVFSCLMMAQASGLDLWGTVARWTDDGFRFQIAENDSPQWYDDYWTDLEVVGIEEDQLPTWLPQDYALDAIQVSKKLDHNEVQVLLTSQGPAGDSLLYVHFLRSRNHERSGIFQRQPPRGEVPSQWKDGLSAPQRGHRHGGVPAPECHLLSQRQHRQGDCQSILRLHSGGLTQGNASSLPPVQQRRNCYEAYPQSRPVSAAALRLRRPHCLVL